MIKVILNVLPPARIDTPSAAMSVLQSFLLQHHIETRIIYWNILLDGLLPAFEKDTDMIHFDLLPYLYWIAGIMLSRYIRRHFPDAKIVIGGLRNPDKAEALMRMCTDADFAIWGEGEYPLLQLCQAITDHTKDLNSIPRLIFRQEGSLQSSETDAGKFYDLNSRIFPAHDDYFHYLHASDKRDIAVILPLESSRGCTWNACRFCVYGEGYKNRKKDSEVLKEEIHYLLKKYSTCNFAFMDNDIVANDPKRLGKILDDLIAIKQRKDIQFIAEVIPKNFTAEIMQKLPRAGFNRIHFGYESLSDRLLVKMKKRTNFSDNIFFVKFARRCKIKLPSANVICGSIGEDDIDILESIDNLHFLRFFFDKNLFRHNLIPLMVAKHSDFYDMIAKDKLMKWDENAIFYLLPGKITRGIDRFSLFDFSAEPNYLWTLFSKLNDFYYDHAYSYSISRQDQCVIYREFFDGEPVIELALNDLEYRILQLTNSTIMDLSDLIENLGPENDAKTIERSVCRALDRLKEKHLLYFNNTYQSIISIIDTD